MCVAHIMASFVDGILYIHSFNTIYVGYISWLITKYY